MNEDTDHLILKEPPASLDSLVFLLLLVRQVLLAPNVAPTLLRPAVALLGLAVS